MLQMIRAELVRPNEYLSYCEGSYMALTLSTSPINHHLNIKYLSELGVLYTVGCLLPPLIISAEYSPEDKQGAA